VTQERDNINIMVPQSVKDNFYRVLRKYQTKYPHKKVYEFLNSAILEYEEKLGPRYPV
jgi:hypothetical protein